MVREPCRMPRQPAVAANLVVIPAASFVSGALFRSMHQPSPPEPTPSTPPEPNEEDIVQPTRRMGTMMAGIAWVLIIVMLTGFFQGWLDHQDNPNRSVQTRVTEGGAREVVLQRNRMGHYVANGEINGVPVTFLLDTGATGVALSPQIARLADVPHGQPIVTRTANGTARGYLTRIDSVRLGNIEQRGVRATISPGLATEEVLLGMSFLKHLELVQKGDTLTLRQ